MTDQVPSNYSSAQQAELFDQVFALHESGRWSEAAAQYQRLLVDFPDNVELLAGLGTLALQQGRYDEAVALLGKSLAIDPAQECVLTNRGLAYAQLRQPLQALACYEQALALCPDYADAYYNRGNVLKELQRPEEALHSYAAALRLHPHLSAAYINRGIVLNELQRYSEALENFQQALALNPNDALAHNNCGIALKGLRRLEAAVASFDRAGALQPGWAEVYNNRGNALEGLRRFAEAVLSYDQAIALNPRLTEVFVNRGNALVQVRRLDEALRDFDQAIALSPESGSAYWCKAVLKLLGGDYAEGWRLFEWRWRDQQKDQLRKFSQPVWLGEESLEGKTLLLHAEQGLGDFIQCCRYAPLLELYGARALLETPPALHALMTTLQGDMTLVNYGEAVPAFDLHCPIMSLPLAFKTTLASIPDGVPYLYADAARQPFWQARLGKKTAPRIGLVWSGSVAHRNDHNRSLPLAMLEPLWQLPFEFHAVQKEFRPADAALLAELGRVRGHAECLGDFADTAALINEMDLLISVDTSVAHLAGALAAPVWILLPFTPDYRWLLERADSPWYPTARLFRQPADGDWGSVIRQLAASLEALL
jgi:tetratricopeptide (TPR) repeat protein